MHATAVPGANGRKIPVARCSFEDLQRRFRRAHGPATPAVPSIEQVLELVDHRTELCFEIKEGPYDPDRFCRRFAEALAAYRPSGDVVVSSFSLDILQRARPYLARFDLRYAFIFKSIKALEHLNSDPALRFDLLHPHYLLALHLPEHYFADGPPLRCWTVNRRGILRRLIARTPRVPIEAVMTNDIDLAVPFA